MTLREQKQVIRAFLQTPVWTEEKLCALLAHAQDKLSMWSCCCLIGVATADHALMPRILYGNQSADEIEAWGSHYGGSTALEVADRAERAFLELGGNHGIYGHPSNDPPDADALRRRRIRPIIRAELRRRAHVRSSEPTPERLGLDVGLVEVEWAHE